MKTTGDLSESEDIKETVRRKSSHPCDMQDAYVPPQSFVTPDSYVTSEPFLHTEHFYSTNASSNNSNNILMNDSSLNQLQDYNNHQSTQELDESLSQSSHHISEERYSDHLRGSFSSGDHQLTNSFDSSCKSDDYSKSDGYNTSDIDEGLFTDMSLSHSTSPASTLSKASTSSSYSSKVRIIFCYFEFTFSLDKDHLL